MSTTSMNISLSEGLKAKVTELVELGNFSNPSDYVRDLIRKDLEAKQEDLRLRELLQVGLHSPVLEKDGREIFQELRDYIKNKSQHEG